MASVTITPEMLPAAFRREAEKARRALKIGISRACMQGKRRLMRATREKDKSAFGQYYLSFKIRPIGTDGSMEIVNTAPHAGIIELGARPHPVSDEGIEALTRWVVLKMDVEDDVEAKQIAYNIALKLMHHGQEPTYIFKDEMPRLREYLAQNTANALREQKAKP